VSDINSLST